MAADNGHSGHDLFAAGETGITSEEKAREERLLAIQMEALGTGRRERISTEDSRREQRRIDLEALESSRLVNKAGSNAFKKAQENREWLSGWNNTYQTLAADSSGEVLESLDDGQSHRASLSARLASSYDDDPNDHHHGGSVVGRGGRTRGSGRGGGVMGTRGRGNWGQGTTRIPSQAQLDATPKSFGLQTASERNEIDHHRRPVSFSMFKEAAGVKEPASKPKGAPQLRLTGKDPQSFGSKGKQGGQQPWQTATGTRGQPNRARAFSRTLNRGATTASMSRRENRQPRQPSPDYESRLASPEVFMAATARIFPRPPMPPTPDTVAPQARPPPAERPTPTPVVRLPTVTPASFSFTTRTDSQSQESARPRRKSVRFADTDEEITPAEESSIFGDQVDHAPVGVHVLSSWPGPRARSPPEVEPPSYMDDLYGLEWAQGTPQTDTTQAATGNTEGTVGEGEQRSEGEAIGTDNQGRDEKEHVQDDLGAKDEAEIARLTEIITNLKLTGLAPEHLIAQHEDDLAEVQARAQNRLSSARKNTTSLAAETKQPTSQETKALTEESSEQTASGVTHNSAETRQAMSPRDSETAQHDWTRGTEAVDDFPSEERDIIGEHIHRMRFNRRPSILAQPTLQPIQEVISPASSILDSPIQAPQGSLDFRSSLWQTTGADPTYATQTDQPLRTNVQDEGHDIIGERVLPGRTSSLVASPRLGESGSPTMTTAAHIEPEHTAPPQITSIARPNIVGRVTPNIPDNAATRQYAGLILSTSASRPGTAVTPIDNTQSAHIITRELINTNETATYPDSTITRLTSSTIPMNVTTTTNPSSASSAALSFQTHGASAARLNESIAPWTSRHTQTSNPAVPQPTYPDFSTAPQSGVRSVPSISSSHAPRPSRQGAAPITSPFLLGLQGTTALPTSGVGSATWLQYNQGPAPQPRATATAQKLQPTPGAAVAPTESATSSTSAIPSLGDHGALSPERTKQLPPIPAKDAWGRVRRSGA